MTDYERKEILLKAKPILFNTEMVRAILDGRKTVTRRAVKLKYSNTHLEMRTDKYGTRLIEIQNEDPGVTVIKNPDGTTTHKLLAYIERMPLYRPGDILYVRETWGISNFDIDEQAVHIVYKAGNEKENCQKITIPKDKFERLYNNYSESEPDWHPSIHMPKEAARIFLRVTGVRVERLQDIDGRGILAEGMDNGHSNPTMGRRWENMQRMAFSALWNSTIKKKDLDKYGWGANPWVWVIEFERID